MSWTRAIAYVVLALLLGGVLWATTPPPPPPATSTPEAPGPDIVAMRVVAGERTVEAHRVNDRWQVAPPHGEAVTSDLVDALLGALLNAPAEPVASTGKPDEFGLEHPYARIQLARREGKPVTVTVGRTNPSDTGVYGQLEGNPQIVLMGLNVRYYIELMTH